ncbi:hypothetical protein KEH57_04190 [Burkholderia cenocepacia]|uniref:hypothetical protein n=1 Tax=Burkholderia cenocepacia TaxID=95486 RepID=UPI001BA67348|nr:hypothetical protein [Burkholderia cenocepacia]QUO26136.1 hypothetical protein KEH57_04190 [Burkholderia cenocepacia]
MNYYGLADFAGGFNRVRDDALDSGFRAKQRMRDDWLADYQMPERMLASDAGALSNSLKVDTLDQGYDDMLNYGLNRAALGAQTSGVNLRMAQADNTLASLRAQAINQGLNNDADIAQYVASNLDPAEMVANPYLAGSAFDARQAANRRLLAMGAGLGGSAGDALAARGLSGMGYGLTPGRDEAGNLVLSDPQGLRTGAFGLAGQIPAALALSGDVAPLNQYYGNLERMRADAARLDAQLQQRDAYADLRYQTELERQQMRNDVAREGMDSRERIAAMRGSKGMPSSAGAAAIGGTMGGGMGGTAQPRMGGGGMSGMSSPAGAPTGVMPSVPSSLSAPNVYQPARLTPDAAARLAALDAGTVAPSTGNTRAPRSVPPPAMPVAPAAPATSTPTNPLMRFDVPALQGAFDTVDQRIRSGALAGQEPDSRDVLMRNLIRQTLDAKRGEANAARGARLRDAMQANDVSIVPFYGLR